MSINTVNSDEATIADRIKAARNLWKLWGQPLMQDEEVRALLYQLNLKIEATQRAMVDAGIVRVCADCALSGQGTCCGARTGYKSDNILLMINLMLGRSLPAEAADLQHCHFLTEHGCALRARHVICINFVCQRLVDAIPHKLLCNVQQVAGREMDALFAIEECIKRNMA